MTALDIIFLLLVGLGLVFGVRRGFVAEVIALATWVAIVLAIRLLHGPLSDALVGPVGTVSGANVLAFALIFLTVFIAGKLIARTATGGLRRASLGTVDRLLGGGFGALKGLLGVVLLYLAFTLVYDTIWGRAAERPDWVRDARTFPLVYASADLVIDFVETRRGVQPGMAGTAEREAGAGGE
jgi:membrane protein required for colicin V production